MYKFIILITLFLVLNLPNLYANGSTAASFLNIGVGAKNIAMGETGAAELGINAVYWNPAGLIAVDGREIAFMHSMLIADINYENVIYAQKLPVGTIGIAANYLSMEEMPKYDNTGTLQTDSFKPTDMSISVSFARRIGIMPIGITLKYITSNIDDETADTFAVDYGIIYYTPIDGFEVGFAIQNLGTYMQYDQESHSLPTNIKLGAYYMVADNAGLCFDMNKGVNKDVVFNTGAEYIINFSKKMSLSVMGGYKSDTKGLTGSLKGVSGGLGLTVQNMSLDYAFVPFGDLDNIQRISLSFMF